MFLSPASRARPRNLNIISSIAPGGRLTLTSATPVMGSSVAGATSIFYTPAIHSQVPLWNGSKWVPTFFNETSQALTDTTKSPAAAAASSVYDMFAWQDGGTFRVTRGPAWTNTTTRSAGTVSVKQNGIYINSVSITNGPVALRGTYVGTIATNGSSTVDYIFGGLGAGGVAAVFNVWNTFNRVPVGTMILDSTDTWNYAVSSTWRAANASSTVRATMVRGLDVDPVYAFYNGIVQAGAGANAFNGVGVDSTTTYSGSTGGNSSNALQCATAIYVGLPGQGQHFVSAIEYNSNATASVWYGDGGAPSFIQSGFNVQLSA